MRSCCSTMLGRARRLSLQRSQRKDVKKSWWLSQPRRRAETMRNLGTTTIADGKDALANLGGGVSACLGHALGSRFSFLLWATARRAACQPETETAPPEVRPVRTVTVVKHESGETVAFTGRIEAENETRLAFRIGGRLIGRAAKVGERRRPPQRGAEGRARGR